MSDTFHFIDSYMVVLLWLMIDIFFWNPKLEMLYPETIKKQTSQTIIF